MKRLFCLRQKSETLLYNMFVFAFHYPILVMGVRTYKFVLNTMINKELSERSELPSLSVQH